MTALVDALTLHLIGLLGVIGCGVGFSWADHHDYPAHSGVPIALLCVSVAGGGTLLAFTGFRLAYMALGLPPTSLLGTVAKLGWVICWGLVATILYHATLTATMTIAGWSR